MRLVDSGRRAVPGGYMEPGETFKGACACEVLEETGLCFWPRRLIAVYTSPHVLLEYSDGNCHQLVVLHFAAQPIGGQLSVGPETSEVRYASREEIEHLDMSDFQRQSIDDAFAAQPFIFVREDHAL